MKLLFVSSLNRADGVSAIINEYIRVGEALGHKIALLGEPSADTPAVRSARDVSSFDFVIFVIRDASDLPGLPDLAHLLDRIPRERRVVIDCFGRFNETVRVEGDSNHGEGKDRHEGWEWVEAFQAISSRILQPTPAPLRADVQPFLFYAYDGSTGPTGDGARREPRHASSGERRGKPYGVVYAGDSGPAASHLHDFLAAIQPVRDDLGPVCVAGRGWRRLAKRASENGAGGDDVDPGLTRFGVETRKAIPSDELLDFIGQARFYPVFQRPLLNRLRLISPAIFEAFRADTIPLLMLPTELVEPVYGRDARLLAPGDDVAGRLRDMVDRPQLYREASEATRSYLARSHSYERRFRDLLRILKN